MKKILNCILCLFLCVAFVRAEAQKDQASSLLTLDRIFSSDEFSTNRFGPARWLKHKSGYTTLEKSEDLEKGRDIVCYDPESGERQVLVSAQQLIHPESSTPLEINDYHWSKDGKKLLVFTNSQRVWRRNTRGDYWVLDLNSGSLHQIGGSAEPSSLMFAKFSPDGQKVGYVYQNNIYVEDLFDHQIIQITKDGSETIINGTFDWVYEEEFSLRDGFRWSPDSARIAFWQLDTKGVGEFTLVNYTDGLYPKLKTFQYPKVGTINSACRVGVMNSQGGRPVWLKVPGDPRSNYIARMQWAANSEEVILQHLNRLQNTLELMLGNAETGDVRTILKETDKAWVEVVNDLHWINNGKEFIWASEKDGWNHLYVVSREGEKPELITKGEFDVIDVMGLDIKNGWVYYIASPDDPAQRFLFRSPLDGKGPAERITPKGVGGSHSYQMSPCGQWAIHTFSAFGIPPIVDLVRLPEHGTIRILEANSKLHARVKALQRQPVEFFQIDIGEAILDAYCMKPVDFDPGKQYPLLFYIYGEPAGSTVRDSWGGSNYLWHILLNQKGYLVMSVDNRGTKVPKGRAWRKSIYRQIGILASKDQAAACKRIMQQRLYVDPDRIGIWGWSGGGSMSLNMIFRYPDLYRTAMAIATVSNQRFYDTIYQERYMGLPEDNPQGYTQGSPVTHAQKLKGNLLLVHGTGDDNCHYQSAEALINELIRHNKMFSFMSYPNRSHGIHEGENTRRHLYETLTRFLYQNLPPGETDSPQQTASTVEPPRTADRSFQYEIKRPAYPFGQGPVVLIDEAHNNFHTAVSTYWPFAKLLEQDGYVVKRGKSKIDEGYLSSDVIYVIADAQPPAQKGDPPAFSYEEIRILNQWVQKGGCLFVITDHMPDPEAVKDLALSFGIEVNNGYVLSGLPPGRREPIVFERDKGTLADHILSTGRNSDEKVRQVATFTGSAFRVPDGFDPILVFEKGYLSWMPKEYYQFHPDTPHIDVSGWYQGGVKSYGKGRLAFFAEAAMFTAQVFDNGNVKAGMNHPNGRDNARLLLNIFHWFSGLLE
ncbi:MAG: prolyl oligopeptidase family serine peptidase [Candidatus Aminicenantes bacterium]|nr:prolyl oligopeptidase family serine peptidase [Candidatus Aminicenantes bacterium]